MKPIPIKAFDKAVESMFAAADANKDGMVTLAELNGVITARRNAVLHQRFVDIDTNHDGRIDEAEFIAWQSRKGGAAMADDGGEFAEIVADSIGPDLGNGERNDALMIAVEPLNAVVIAKANTNYDAGITLDELMAYEHARFTKADTNQDLFLSREEVEAMIPNRGPRRDGPGGPQGGPPPGSARPRAEIGPKRKPSPPTCGGEGFLSVGRRSVAGQDAVHQLLHRGGEVVGIERVLLEAIGRVAGKHQVLLRIAAMGDVLQGLLDAEAARIGHAPRGPVVMVLPGRKAAMRKAAHAIGLILADRHAVGRRHENHRVVGRAHRLGKALAMPGAGTGAVTGVTQKFLPFTPTSSCTV
jgi:hypothetical protein